MKIYLFREPLIEPFRIHCDPGDISCMGDVVIVRIDNMMESYCLLNSELFWIESNGISEVCVLLFVEKAK